MLYEGIVRKRRVRIDDKYALRYAVIEIIESLALIAHRIAHTMDYPLDEYVKAMRFTIRLVYLTDLWLMVL